MQHSSSAALPSCSNCAFFVTRHKGCARVVIHTSKSEAHFEGAQVVRLSPACGPSGKGFVAKVGLQVVAEPASLAPGGCAPGLQMH